MNAQEFEDKVQDLISQAQDAGVSPDEIISALEVTLMAYREEHEEEI